MFFSILYIECSYLQTYYYSFIILLCQKWFFFQNIRKIIVFVKHCFTSKIRIKHVIICYKNLYTTYLLNWFVYFTWIWIRFENHYVLLFKYILYVFWFLKPLSLTMFWALPMEIYVGTETSFILRFATDLCVIFGPCHKDNMTVVTKDCLVYVLYLYLYLNLNLNLYLNLNLNLYLNPYMYLYLFLNMFNLLFANKIIYFILWTQPNVLSKPSFENFVVPTYICFVNKCIFDPTG